MSSEGKLFVWRDIQEGIADIYQHSVDVCPYCSSTLQSKEPKEKYGPIESDADPDFWGVTFCQLCGWAYMSRLVHEWWVFIKYYSRIMRSFNIDNASITLSELGSHLKNHFSDIYSISPTRFEQIVCDLFRSNGYDTLLTKQSHDGGVDIFLFDKCGEQVIVECKRYAEHRKVGIDLVRSLIGACVMWESRKAYLVTSSSFSKEAQEGVKKAQRCGYELNLVDASALLSLLNVYNDELPPLDKISEDIRKRIRQGKHPGPFLSLEETFKKFMV